MEHILGLWKWTFTEGSDTLYTLYNVHKCLAFEFYIHFLKSTSCFGQTQQAVWLSDDKHKVEMYKEDVTGGRVGGWEVDGKEKE